MQIQTSVFGEMFLVHDDACSRCDMTIPWNGAKIAFALPLKRRVYCGLCYERIRERLLRFFMHKMRREQAYLKMLDVAYRE